MSYGKMMAMRSGKHSDGRRSDHRYDSPRNEYGGSMRDEYDGGVYNYDRYRYSDGRFAPKGREHRTHAEMDDSGIYDSFYDRDGRKHYDNGRYAPMRSYHDGGVYDMIIGFGDREGQQRRQEMERHQNYDYFPSTAYNHEGYSDEERRHMKEREYRRELGHASLYEDRDGYFFKGRFGGNKEQMPIHMTRNMAEEWTLHMKNADGSKGAHWNIDQVKQLQEQKKELQGFDLPDVYAAINMLYSDYCEVAKKFNVNNIDFYVCMAKAWLDDEDAKAGEAKTALYYEYIAK